MNREGARAALILLALLVLCFLPFVFGNKTLLESARQASSIMPYGAWKGKIVSSTFATTKDPGGPAWEAEPLLELTRNEYLQEKTLPFWNPYQAYGTPLAANMQSQVFYPLTVALSLWHTPRVRNWYLLSRLFLAGVCAYFYIRLFVSFLPALAAGVTSMLAGYYVLYISMPHLSVEVLIPAALLSAEYLIRRPRFRTLTWFAVVVFGILSGGMPESSLLVLSFVYVYVFFRIATDNSLRHRFLRRASFMLLATCIGFCFAAVLLLPFRQYMRHSFDTHQFANTRSITGLIHEQVGPSIFTYAFPFLFGPGWDNNLRNYIGLISPFLFLIAVLAIAWCRWDSDRNLNLLTCFFGILAIATVAKRYGFTPINQIGSLPLFNLVLFPKYEEPIFSFSVSILSAIGLERLAKAQVSPMKQAMALALTFLIAPLAVILSRDMVVRQLTANKISGDITGWSIFLPTALLLALSLSLIVLNSKWILDRIGNRAVRLTLSWCVLGALSCEAAFSYVIPTYYLWNTPATVASNPYSGAPFIDWLKAASGGYRIFAEDGVLLPDWASAFGLFDIRSLDAMYYRKYLPFVQQFFPDRRFEPGVDLYDRFLGSGIYRFDNWLQERLLQLSSVKYLVTMPSTALDKNIVDEILVQNAGHLAAGKASQISRQTLEVGGITRIALGEHPPYDRLPYRFRVDNEKEIFHFSYGINPAAFPICGDGVEFIVEVRDSRDGIKKLFANYIDPRHEPGLRRWINGTVDLSSYHGRYIDLLLTTNGGPRKDVCADWAVWSDFYFDNRVTSGPMKLVYNHEVNIYEYEHTLPRAIVYYSASVKQDEGEVLKELRSRSFDPFHTVLLNGSGLDRRATASIMEINNVPAGRAEAAKIISYKSQVVIVEASLTRPGILVLNDSDYPGWTVDVDGATAKILTANYLFRGVLLESGRHTVRFSYRPASVRAGTAISIGSLLSFVFVGLMKVRNDRRRRPVI